jgi:hypothetical protein
MSADVINATTDATRQLPVWTIHGVNWQVDVPLNEYNAQFPTEAQADEAATIAVAVLKGKRTDLQLKLDEGEDKPFLGTTMIAHLKGTDPNKGLLPLTHLILANDGYYKEAMEMFIAFNKQMKEIHDAFEKEQQQNATNLLSQLNNFKKLQQAVAKTGKKKPRKKKP